MPVNTGYKYHTNAVSVPKTYSNPPNIPKVQSTAVKSQMLSRGASM